MKPGLEIGARKEFTATVTDAMKAGFGDIQVHDLYSTAAMITHMEWACRQHILPYLESGEEGVGFHIDVRHLNPTPIGETVRVAATVTTVEPGRVTCNVEAWNAVEKIGEGTIVQGLIPEAMLHVRAEQVKSKQPRQPEAEALSPEVLPPAVLSGELGNRFSLKLLAWESKYPCTRYDEWLISEGKLLGDAVNFSYKGAFLLRYEIEQLREALVRLTKDKTAFQALEFMEPTLRITGEPDTVGPYYHIAITLASGTEGEAKTLEITCGDGAIESFCQALSHQLAQFPSEL